VAATAIAYPSVDERRAYGEGARKRTPPSAHSGWKPAADRPDPVTLLEEQDATRMPGLVPVRHGRMMVSPFTFYRGAAAIMAADLAATPVAVGAGAPRGASGQTVRPPRRGGLTELLTEPESSRCRGRA
jgi:hypothetical protein